MFELGEKDLQAALGFAGLLHSAGDLGAFREAVPTIRQLVACDTVGYNEID
ncbi:MAG: hypothetical protein JO169_05370, partial [Solirubrobacterales bacterium]|nr:hypothetical protein [Solirubrobacterales bacterium]